VGTTIAADALEAFISGGWIVWTDPAEDSETLDLRGLSAPLTPASGSHCCGRRHQCGHVSQGPSRAVPISPCRAT